MKNSFKTQLWVSLGVVFGTIIATGIGLYFLSGDLTAQGDKIITDKTLIARQTAVLGVLAQLKSDAPRAAQYQAAINKLLPAHDNLISFSPWLDALGQAHKVSVAFSFTGGNMAVTDTAPGSDGFSMSAQGAAADLAAFLGDLESQAPGFLLSIDSFDLINNGSDYKLSTQGRLFSK